MFRRKNGVSARMDAIERRLRSLESESQDAESGRAGLDEAIRVLSQRLYKGSPQFSQMNMRFRSFEWAALNIKQLGYQLARQLADQQLRREVLFAPAIELKSSLCTQADIESDWLLFWCAQMRAAPIYHRKLWELCYICQVLFTSGKLQDGVKGLGFGCGQESLPSVFVKHGATVLATDLDSSRAEAKEWQESGQHAASVEALRMRNICADEDKLSRINFRSVDMNAIPQDFNGQFDFCWSACALEHLGSIEKGFKFIENSLHTLRSGGVAVHTTEFNLQDGETIDNWPTVLFQKHHLLEFAERMTKKGYVLEPFDFNPGTRVLDGFVDIPPWGSDSIRLADASAHLKLCVDGFPCTSVGIIIRKPA